MTTIHWTRQDEVIRASMAVDNQAQMIRDTFADSCRRADAFRLKMRERIAEWNTSLGSSRHSVL